MGTKSSEPTQEAPNKGMIMPCAIQAQQDGGKRTCQKKPKSLAERYAHGWLSSTSCCLLFSTKSSSGWWGVNKQKASFWEAAAVAVVSCWITFDSLFDWHSALVEKLPSAHQEHQQSPPQLIFLENKSYVLFLCAKHWDRASCSHLNKSIKFRCWSCSQI